jgi:uncharacterized protein
VFEGLDYVSLEDLDEREFALQDPRGFLNRFPDGAIFDEAQRAPALFSYLQTRVDAGSPPGRFVLTGSAQFELLMGITQSLAGRAALLSLLPFELGELQAAGRAPESCNDLLFRGLYPPVHDRSLDPHIWYTNYTRTFLERDLRQIVNVRDLSAFQRFVRMCAARVGQLLNLSSLANDCGITVPTARQWISVLEASYVVHLLPPHFENFRKRLIKTPKLYFHDTGLACYLLGIEAPEQLSTHPMRGPLFESWAISELIKRRLHAGQSSNLYFWRDRTGNEIDVLIDSGNRLHPVEIRSGQTLNDGYFRMLDRWADLAGDRAGAPTLIFAGDTSALRDGVRVVGWRDMKDL